MIIEFLKRLYINTKRKAELYDGVNKNIAIDTTLRLATEELGEVATAITRERWNSAMDECIDLAHCAFLIYKSVYDNKIKPSK